MRDVIKILAAGTLLTAYAVIAPTMVEAVPGPVGAGKPFAQRLARAGGDAPVSAVTGAPPRMETGRAAGLPRFVRLGLARP